MYLRNEFNFCNVHGIMNTSGLLQSKSGTANGASKMLVLHVQLAVTHNTSITSGE